MLLYLDIQVIIQLRLFRVRILYKLLMFLVLVTAFMGSKVEQLYRTNDVLCVGKNRQCINSNEVVLFAVAEVKC